MGITQYQPDEFLEKLSRGIKMTNITTTLLQNSKYAESSRKFQFNS